MRYPNGSSAEHIYDAAGRVESITNRQGSSVVSSFSYTYDANGNRLSQSETNGAGAEATTYDYDTNDRLLAVHYPDLSTAYTYDAAYNRRSEISTDRATASVTEHKIYSYNTRNQVTEVSDQPALAG